MRLLLIKNGAVENAIAVDPKTVEAFRKAAADYLAQFDAVFDADDEPGSPGVGWTFDGKAFAPPAAVEAALDVIAELKAKLDALTARVASVETKEATAEASAADAQPTKP